MGRRAIASGPRTNFDGQYIAFLATGSNLPDHVAPGEDPPHLFRKDLLTGDLIRLSPNVPDVARQFSNDQPISQFSMSDKGDRVAYVINRPILDGDDPSGYNVLLWDELAGITRLSESSQREASRAPGPSSKPDLNYTGEVYTFFSQCTQYVPVLYRTLFQREDNFIQGPSRESAHYLRDLVSGQFEALELDPNQVVKLSMTSFPQAARLSAEGDLAVFNYDSSTPYGYGESRPQSGIVSR